MNRLLILYILLLGFEPLAQKGWEDCSLEAFSDAILKAEKSIQIDGNYSYKASYKFYESLTIEEPKLELEALLISRGGKEIYMSQFGRIMVQNENLNVVCDTAMKNVVINEPNNRFFDLRTTEDFGMLLNSRCTAKRKIEKTLTKYYLEFPSGGKYLAAEVWLLNDGKVDTYILYTANDILDDSEEKDKIIRPRMEVKYSDYHFGTNVPIEKMNHVKDFVLLKENTLFLTEKYKDYELIDLRISNN